MTESGIDNGVWRRRVRRLLAGVCLGAAVGGAIAQSGAGRGLRVGDHISAVVNTELVTAYAVERRAARARQEARRAGAREPAADALHKQVVDALIDERVLITYARDSGARVDEAELDRAVNS